MSAPPSVRSYLPWVRQGIVAGLPVKDTLGPGLPARAHVPLDLWVNDPQRARPEARIQVPLRLHSAGDVAGIDPGQVVRVEPRHLSTDFEPNLFALVELDRPDLPWLFTPARANAAGRLRPWIVLVVVEQARAAVEHDPTAPLPVLDAPLGELPDLAESWAWAHAQVTRLAGGGLSDTVAAVLRDRPDHTVARLLCARRLRPRTAYVACVVPAFAEGGSGELAPAWEATGPADERVRLPVYYYWEFTTGAGGDFEELVRRLQPRALPDGVGVVPLDLTAPGWGLEPRPDVAPLPMTAALRRAGEPPESEDDVDAELRAALREAVAGGGGTDVAPPVYGQWYTREPRVPPDGAEPSWLRELNLDPRTRVAAGLGTLAVRYEQERLVADAWSQLARRGLVARETTRAQLAEEVAAALHDKHLATLAPERLVQLAGPALAAAPANADRAFRRLLGPGGAIGRRLPAPAEGLRAAPQAARQLAERPTTEDVEFAPTFPQPTYELLRDWFAGMLLPGLELVPPNSIALLSANERFIEAFLVGLNHELSRELVWRGFPTTRRGTSFRRFWDTRGDETAGSIPEIRTWASASRLGDHLDDGSSGEQLVLLLRSDLLRRFPRAVISAVEATWTADGRRALGGTERLPRFRGTSRGDVVFVGFDLDADEVRGGTDPAGPAGWFFVLEEQPAAPRFGFDEPDGVPASAPASWDDVTWADVDEAPGAYVRLGGPLAGTTLPRGASAPALSFGQDSAHMAAITQQAPFRLAVHASAWLPAGGDR